MQIFYAELRGHAFAKPRAICQTYDAAEAFKMGNRNAVLN